MVRDWEIVERLLTRIEASDAPWRILTIEDFAPTDPAVASYHLRMLIIAGMVDGNTSLTDAASKVDIKGLTMQGHDLLDMLRSCSASRKTRFLLVDLWNRSRW